MSRPIAGPSQGASREPPSEIPWIVRIANLGGGPDRPVIMPWKLAHYRSRPPTTGPVEDGLDTATVRREGWVYFKRPVSTTDVFNPLRGLCELVPVHPFTREVLFTARELGDFLKNVGLPIWANGAPQGETVPVRELRFIDDEFESVITVKELRRKPPCDDAVSTVKAVERSVGEIHEALLSWVLSQESRPNRERLKVFRKLYGVAYPRDYISAVLSSCSAQVRPIPEVLDMNRIVWTHGGTSRKCSSPNC